MDKPSANDRIRHMLTAIALIEQFMQSVSEADFMRDVQLQSAVQFQFLVIGETVGHMDIAMLRRYDYPWHIPRSFRNFIIHEYHGIKMERIYYAANDLTNLKRQLERMLKKEFGSSVKR
jgi:uncharacterized protein with HEPN domain